MNEDNIAGRYQLGDRIGVGGMGRVWLAHDHMLHRQVAIKEILLPEALSEDELAELRLRTLREARTAARLTHPNVVRVYDVIYADARPWIVMEYVASRSLAQVVKDDRTLTPREAAGVGIALLDALCAAHTAGVLHRDVKPGNVLLADDGRIMLTDFGLATFDDVGTAITQTGVVHGSPQFIAPERALDGTSSPEADMWSLGATLYAAVEGRSPYSRPTSYEILTALATTDPDPAVHAGPLTRVLNGLLRRDPDQRMKPDETRARLQRIVDEPERGQRRNRAPASIDSASPRPLSNAGLPSAMASGGSGGFAGNPTTYAFTPDDDPDADFGPPPPNASAHRYSRPAVSKALMISATAIAVLVAGGMVVQKAFSVNTPTWASSIGSPLTPPSTDPPSTAPTSPPATAPATPVTPTTQTPQGRGPGQGQPQPPPRGPGAQWVCRPVDPPGGGAVPTSKPPAKIKVLTNWIWYAKPDTYGIAMPQGWLLNPQDNTDCFYAPQDLVNIGVDQFAVTTTDPVTALNNRELVFLDAGGMPNYANSGFAKVAGCSTCADWTYTFRGRDGLMKTVVRIFLGKSGQAYTVTWSTLAANWPAEMTDQKNVLASFKALT